MNILAYMHTTNKFSLPLFFHTLYASCIIVKDPFIYVIERRVK